MGKPTQRILLSGASGLIGSAIRGAAREQGMEVTALVRRHHLVGPGAVYWNPAKADAKVHPVGLEGFDAVVHLI